MDREELDRILVEEDELVPSSGFAATVMNRVETETAAPQPIPFPWKRALPGMVLAAAVLVWAAVEMARAIGKSGLQMTLPHGQMSAVVTPGVQQTGWVVLALILAWACWKLALRLSA
jgi:hypothetical protein